MTLFVPLRSSFLVGAALIASCVAVGCGEQQDQDASDRKPPPGEDHLSPTVVRPSAEWKNQLVLPKDSFAVSTDDNTPRWVKFSIFADQPSRVYFQDGHKLLFHKDFLKAHVQGYENITPAEFEKIALKKQGQRVFTGVVLLPPSLESFEVGIELIRNDVYSKEEVQTLFTAVKAALSAEQGLGGLRVFYMPNFGQRAAAEADRPWLESHGIPLASPDRWLKGDACYARGWGFGTLKYFASADIKAAYSDGRLTSTDILLTNGVPAEVPFVAGIVSLAPSTPSSHVALMAGTWKVPFAYPATDEGQANARALVNKEVLVRTIYDADFMSGTSLCRLELVEPATPVDAATRAALADLRKPPPVQIPPRKHLGQLSKDADTLRPIDVQYFGGKASNFGTLRRAIPQASPKVLGVSFDLWEAYLEQTLTSGRRIKDEIAIRLAGLRFPADQQAIEAALLGIQTTITDDTTLPPAEFTQLKAQLQAFGFSPNVRLRFRSSTNVEDGDVLSGAGLYDSYSGCLADDLDGDKAGPSRCDATEAKEKGVERAILKVFASFYNKNAYIERLRYGINESSVGMALAVHPSVPDEKEKANGVATATLQYGMIQLEFVTQLGAESVTNPDGTTTPEEVSVTMYENADIAPVVSFRKGSSLVPIGQKVMNWEQDYLQLATLIARASTQFRSDRNITSNSEALVVDLEYKKLDDNSLSIKQIRTVPQSSSTPSIVPVFLSDSAKFCVDQNEGGTVMGNHRLKAELWATGKNAKLDAAARASSLLEELRTVAMENGILVDTTRPPSARSGYQHRDNDDLLVDSWTIAPGVKRSLSLRVPKLVAPNAIPVMLMRDLTSTYGLFEGEYQVPQLNFGYQSPETTSYDRAALVACPNEQNVEAAVQTRTFSKGAMRIVTKYRYRKIGAFDKTLPLGRFEETTIEGLTSSPIKLSSYFAQTFSPAHHNFFEDFAFEPALDPNVSAAQKAELAAAGIQMLVVHLVSYVDRTPAAIYKVSPGGVATAL